MKVPAPSVQETSRNSPTKLPKENTQAKVLEIEQLKAVFRDATISEFPWVPAALLFRTALFEHSAFQQSATQNIINIHGATMADLVNVGLPPIQLPPLGGTPQEIRDVLTAIREGRALLPAHARTVVLPCGAIAVQVNIAEAPEVVMVLAVGGVFGQMNLNANNLVPNPPGVITWSFVNDGGFIHAAAFNNAALPITAAAAGSQLVRVQHAAPAGIADAFALVHVISVTLNPAPEVLIALPATPIAAPVIPGAPVPPLAPMPPLATHPVIATGLPPGLGVYAWNLAAHPMFPGGLPVQFLNGVLPGDTPNGTLQTLPLPTAGTCNVEVTYSVGAVQAQDVIQCHVISVSIPQAAAAPPNPRVLKRFAGIPGWGLPPSAAPPIGSPARATLDAIGAPLNCNHAGLSNYAWALVAPPGGAQVAAGVAPGGPPQRIEVEAVASGPAIGGPPNFIQTYQPVPQQQFQVDYTVHGVTSTAFVNVDITPGCSQANWFPAVPPAAVNPAAYAVPIPAPAPPTPPPCPHEAARQHPPPAVLAGWPVALQPPGRAVVVAGAPLVVNWVGGATPAASFPHHHGSICPDCCAAHHGIIEHWIQPFGPAVADVLELRNQIRSCTQAFEAAYDLVGGANPAPKLAAGTFAADAWAAAHNWPWLVSAPGHPIDLHQLRWTTNGKMFGVLRGTDSAMNPVKLRACSGPPIGFQHNSYWSLPLPNPNNIPSATRGPNGYAPLPGQNPLGGTFGTCAAPRLLAHALHLGLQIDNMAEMWLGRTLGPFVDGELEASCAQCRRFLGRMLCQAGGLARTDPYPVAAAPLPNFGF